MYGQVWQIALYPEIAATPIQSACLLHPGWSFLEGVVPEVVLFMSWIFNPVCTR